MAQLIVMRPDPAADVKSQNLIVSRLREARPFDAILSEEGIDDVGRLEARRVWIVDPLDGTREYHEDGRLDWAVHIALWEDGDLVAGAVGLPTPPNGEVLSTDDPPPDPDRRYLRTFQPGVAVSRSRPPAFAAAVAAALGVEVVPIGSAGAKAAAVIEGGAVAYVHAGGQYEWDSAAPVAVARARGLHTSRIDGSPLRYNQPDPYLPDLVICHPAQAEMILAAIASNAG